MFETERTVAVVTDEVRMLIATNDFGDEEEEQ
jgi:hypothetical protein